MSIESRVAEAWRTRLIPALDRLANHPAMLFATLWAINALKFPYGNLIHDARLYAFQAQNHATGGAFDHDLFLRFGSQDQFTPFARLAAPMVSALGVNWSFFILYLLSNALLILAMQRLIWTLIDEAVVATAALVFVAVSPLPYGGLGIFHVEEPFFTPRLLSCAIALFALEQTLRVRYVRGFALALAATVIHPLMGCGALLFVAATAALDLLPRRIVVVAGAVLAAGGAAALGYRPLGQVLFATMDEDWLRIVRNASSYNFPGWWSAGDWINAAVSIAIPALAAVTILRGRPRTARFLLAGAVLGAIGLVTMFIAGRVPYRLLLQGQPYRVLWILQVLEIPLAFWTAAHLWQKDSASRAASVVLIGFFGLSGFLGLELGLSFFACCLCLVFFSAARGREWIVLSLVSGLSIGCLLAMLARLWLIASTSDLRSTFDLRTYLGLVGNTPGPLLWLALALGSVTIVVGSRASVRTITAGAVGVAVLTHSIAFAAPRLARSSDGPSGRERDIGFVREYFERRRPQTGTPATVYEAIWSDVGLVWFDLEANCYFHLVQLSGVLFNRQTAVEGQRRADVIRPFALAWHRPLERFMGRWDRMMTFNVWGPDQDPTPPTEADLRRLCRVDEEADVAILSQHFPNLAAADNGRVFIYECASVRAKSSPNGR